MKREKEGSLKLTRTVEADSELFIFRKNLAMKLLTKKYLI